MAFTVRLAEPADLPHMWEMLWEATAVAESMRAIGKEAALATPEARKYLAGWGRDGDLGVVAVEADGTRLGAAWVRRFTADQPGYGYIADDIPELSIGVSPAARGLGVGGALIDALLDAARERGIRAICLSVDKENRAQQLYERHGFRDAGIDEASDTSRTMVVELLKSDTSSRS